MRYAWPFLCCVVAVIVSGALLPEQPLRGEAGLPPLTVHTVAWELVEHIDTQRYYTGQLEAVRSTELSFDRSDLLVEVLVSEGQSVRAGEPLARIDTRGLLTSRARLAAQKDGATAQLAAMLAGERHERIAAARAQVEELAALLSLAVLDRDRKARLHHDERLGQHEFDAAEATVQAAQSRLHRARSQWNELEAGTRAEDVDAQRALVRQLEAELAHLQVALHKSLLRAPFDGSVARRHLDEGATVMPTAPVLRVVETGRLQARVGISPLAAQSLVLGESVALICDRQVQRATVAAILPELDPATRTLTVLFQVAAGSGLAPGRVVRVALHERRELSGAWLPTSALTQGSQGLWSCYRVTEKGGTAVVERELVEVLHTDGVRVLVHAELPSGARVVADGVHRLVPGSIVEVR